MTEKQYNVILSMVCGVLLVLCFFAFMGKKSLAGETIDTALLNNKYSSDISHVEITHSNKSIYLQKSATDMWLGSEDVVHISDGQGATQSETLVFPVDSTTIKEFITTMEQVRPLSLVSQKQDTDTLSSFGLDNDSGYTVSLSLNDGSTVSQVTFGDKNYSGYRIYLKTPDSPLGGDSPFGVDSPVYETQDQFYPWLTTSGKSWADMALISQSLLGITNENQVQGLTMKFFDKTGTEENIFSPTDKDFSSKVSRLFSLRGGSLILPSVAEEQPLLGEITVDSGLGSQVILRVYQGTFSQVDQDISSYYLIPEYKTTTLKEGFEVSSLNYGFEISPWTWDNLQELAQ